MARDAVPAFDLADYYATGGVHATARDCRVCGKPMVVTVNPGPDGHDACRRELNRWRLTVFKIQQDPEYVAAWRALDGLWRAKLAETDVPDWFKRLQNSPLAGGR